jgi:hypothetical protein
MRAAGSRLSWLAVIGMVAEDDWSAARQQSEAYPIT